MYNKLTGRDIQMTRPLYERYTSNRAPIFSIFESQYDGCAYVDDIHDIHWAVLCTPFLQHFVAGVPTAGCAPVLEDILFNDILAGQEEKEIVAFADSDRWNDVLDGIYAKHRGVTDGRKIFEFSAEKFCTVERPSLPDGILPLMSKDRALPASHADAWCVRLMSDDQVVCHCDAIMIGDGMAEIDIGTEEAFRSMGYATAAATLLIDNLLQDGLTPSWSCWPFRVESQGLAKKLGFLPQPDARAWIWVEGM